MYENKQEILNRMLPALQATRGLYDLKSLTYDAMNEMVDAEFFSGFHRRINVAADSGTAMIFDVLRALA